MSSPLRQTRRRPRAAARALRRGLGRALLAVACASPLAALAQPTTQPTNQPSAGTPATGTVGIARTVQDPHFGDGLFHLYQDQPFTALTGLMVSQHFGRVSRHADEAELLRGGLLLSYGLHREAGEIFERLLARAATPGVRDRVWYELARLRHQRGAVPEALEAIARVEGRLPGPMDEDRVLLHAQLLMAADQPAAAAAKLEPLVSRSPKARYARYNLGVALIRAGDVPRGTALLEAIGQAPAEDEEYRRLRDKANVALGYAALREERPADARRHLERVRLRSPQAASALLGFGWASLTMGAPAEALVPWGELLEREPGDAAVLEARLAIPHARAELGAFGQALAGYEAAIDAYGAERRRLDESIAAIRAGTLLEGLIERNPGREMSWSENIEALPDLPHAGHLNAVLAQHGFQEAFKAVRDLRFVRRNLALWRDKLDVYRDMLEHRRAGYADRLPAVLDRSKELGLAPITARREALSAEIDAAAQAADGTVLADERQRALRERLDRVQATLAAHAGDPAFDAARERARLAAGALAWELSQAQPERLWQARRALQGIDRELEAARRSSAALRQAQREEPARFDVYQQRLAALGPRLDALEPQIAALEREQQLALQAIAVAALEAQKERIDDYTAQARLAVARFYDRATLTRTADHATPR